MKTQLNSNEMEFISDLCDVLTKQECDRYHYETYVNDGTDVRYTEEAQDIFNNLYDTYETMYIKLVKEPLFTRMKTGYKEVKERAQELLDFGNSREKCEGVGMMEAMNHIDHYFKNSTEVQ